MKNVKYHIIFLFIFVGSAVYAQNFGSPVVAFNQAANEYIYEGTGKAVQTLNRALQQFPEDEKLKALLEKILKDEKEQQQNQQNQKNQQKENQQQKDQQKQDQQQSQQQKQQQDQAKEDRQSKEQSQEQADQEKNAEEKESGENARPQQAENTEEQQEDADQAQIHQNLQEMNISPEKAQMILDAMKNDEIQYIQQMEREPTRRPDASKPDW